MIHVMYAAPVKRGAVEVIEDVVPLIDVHMSLASAAPAKQVMLVPEETALPFTSEGGRTSFTIPRLVLNQIVAIQH